MVVGKTRNRGDGNVDYPVVYLGLNRTHPVGEVANPVANEVDFTDDELTEFLSWYQRIIVSPDESIVPMRVSKRGLKETLLVNTDGYDYLANSAGQDNLGQILGAPLSFKRLQAEMGSDYHGGLLLIDELDATLFPSSQSAQLDLLYEVAPELKLQVVCTIHSIHLIKHALEMSSKESEQIEVLYFKRRSSGIMVSVNPPVDAIEADLLIRPLAPPEDFRVDVWCEDDEAAWLLRQILTSRIKRKCRITSARLSCGELSALAIRDIETLRYVLFVVDGDSDKGAGKKIRECSRRFVLPGGSMSPEASIYEMLKHGIPDDHPFFEEHPLRYSQQMVVRRYEDGWREFEANGGEKRRKYNKKKWVQSHPAIQYDQFLVQHAIKAVEAQSPLGKMLFSRQALTCEGVCSGEPPERVRLVSDDDVVFIAKNRIDDPLVEEYFDRSARRHPVWKSEAEFMALFASGGELSPAMEEMRNTLRDISESLEAKGVDALLNAGTIDFLASEIEGVDTDDPRMRIRVEDAEKLVSYTFCKGRFSYN